MKRFRAVIKAKTDTGMSMSYTLRNPVGLLIEAINFALLDGVSKVDVIAIVEARNTAITSSNVPKQSMRFNDSRRKA